ncbi:MAG TPA: helix-turn-helix domain-containing protein [Acidisarcina sp.]
MNFARLHEALRLEILRRIERGVLSGTLLARQTGFEQAHISNFLRGRRYLSMNAMDRVLTAQGLSVEDLFSPGRHVRSPTGLRGGSLTENTIPLVSQSSAIFESFIAPRDVIAEFTLLPGTLDSLRARSTAARRAWQRFVAVRITAVQARAMDDVLSAHAVVLIDRHYNSPLPYTAGVATLYAVARGNTISIRYVDFHESSITLRPASLSHPVQVVELLPGQTASDLLVGRACFRLSTL